MQLELHALKGDTPIGFMAAAGLLRVAPRGCRLSWDGKSQTARLLGIEREALLDHLVSRMQGRSDSAELHLRDEVGKTVDDVRKMPLPRYREIVASADAAVMEWIRAFWWEDGDTVQATGLCFTSGPQRMIRMARDLAALLDPAKCKGGAKQVLSKFEEALFGPWRYADDVASWGWDPVTYRPGSITAEAPEKMKMEGVAGAYWLAWESLPLFPNIPGRGTLGFDYERKHRAWNWTSWNEPLDIHAVRALLRRPEEAVALGGKRYRAGIIKAGHYQFFEPARG